MAVKLSPVYVDAQFINGIPANGAKLFTYAAGSSTKLNTYTDSTGSVAQANPIILNSRGEPASPIWLTSGQSYKFVFASSTDTDPPTSPIRTIDNVTGVNDTSLTIDQWVSSGVTPTYVSATQFTLPGDQTSAFEVGRRIKATVTAGTVYGQIIASAYAALTTVTVVLDSGNLDSGLSSVQYSILTASNPSIPYVKTSSGRIGVNNATFTVANSANIASAATLDLSTAKGNEGHITGTNAVSAVTMLQGQAFHAIYDSACPLTYHATNHKLNTNGQSVTLTAGDSVYYYYDGTTVYGFIMKQDGTATNRVMRGYISGLTMSTAGSSATMTIAAGEAADSTNSVLMTLAASISKTTSAWAVGSGNGGLDTGAIANSTWYYFYEIVRPDTGVVDVVFSTSSSSPTLPTSYTKYRYIGAGLTNGSAQWTAFTQVGDDFYWSTPPALDFSGAGSATAALLTCTLPRGRKMKGYFNVAVATAGAANLGTYLSDPSNADVAPSSSAAPLASILVGATGSLTMGGQASCWTNTSAQIRHREQSTATLYIATLGWMDLRGRFD